MNLEEYIETTVQKYGGDILSSECMLAEKKHLQHGCTSIYDHSYNVACVSLYLAIKFHMEVNKKSLIRGALLHDYFMYDWHTCRREHIFHGFTHARCALKNALRDFEVDSIEKNIILRHMFPLNIVPPRYKEGLLVCIADKLCAVAEAFSFKIPIFNQ